MKIIVTGGTGFVGKEIVNLLVKQGHHVISISQSADISQVQENLQYIRCNLFDLQDCKNQLATLEFDAIVHAASIIPKNQNHSICYSANITMLENLLEILDLQGKYFLLLSTIDVYGNQINEVIDEETTRVPVSYYGFSKKICEDYLEFYQAKKNFKCSIARLTQVYGPGDQTAKLIPNMINYMLSNSEIVIQGGGQELRDYIYVKDAAKIITTLVNNEIQGTYNIATGVSWKIAQVIDIISEAIAYQRQIIYNDNALSKGSYRINIDKLHSKILDLEFTPIHQGIYETIQFIS